MNSKIRQKHRDTIIHSLKGGVVPRIGLEHIQVGRLSEIKALDKDIDSIVDGGARFRFIIGEYGSGKTFFMHLIRLIALKKKLVTIHADLSPERRVYSTAGQATNLLSELMTNMSTRAKPDGNALSGVVEKFIANAITESKSSNESVPNIIQKRLHSLTEYVGGYDFASIIEAYWQGYDRGDETLKNNAIRWLRAEYRTKTEARRDLGVRTIIKDDTFYDYLKLMSLFVRFAGYAGLLVELDEMVNLYKLSTNKARNSNYEQLLRIFNDCLQGSANHIGFLMGGTPEFLYDSRKGLYSYPALQSRLAENELAREHGIVDYSSPTLNLAKLTPEELYILLHNLRHVFASGDEKKYLITDEGLESFLVHCHSNIGDEYYKTTRSITKGFLDMLTILEQNPKLKWENLIDKVKLEEDAPTDMKAIPTLPTDVENDETEGLKNFKI
ncbi:MAG: ATP-binding protein [Flavobacteriaceae bacterium]|nr:ATP-binding protein [Flavobacteriaceae bacterium]